MRILDMFIFLLELINLIQEMITFAPIKKTINHNL